MTLYIGECGRYAGCRRKGECKLNPYWAAIFYSRVMCTWQVSVDSAADSQFTGGRSLQKERKITYRKVHLT